MRQVERNIANIIVANEKKAAELEKVQDITLHCTSDDGIKVTAELYSGDIARYLIEGTRAKMTITVHAKTRELTRKPRNEKPWSSVEFRTYCSDIKRIVREIEAE